MSSSQQIVLSEIATHYNRALLESINTHGLLAYSQKPEGVEPNAIYGTSEYICVNYLDLRQQSLQSESDALKTAMWEEFTGVFGISVERVYPLENLREEIIIRLANNIVFVLEPPKVILGKPSTVNDAHRRDSKINRGYTTQDGYSRQGRKLLTDQNIVGNSAIVTEIKTKHKFLKKDIICALVPSDLMILASSCLINIKLIEVPSRSVALQKLPQLLEDNHQQRLEQSITCTNVPDYEKIIMSSILPSHKQFSLHAVRLTTSYDLTPRFVANIQVSRELLEKISAKVVYATNSDSSWIVHNKRFSYEHPENGDHIMHTRAMIKYFFEQQDAFAMEQSVKNLAQTYQHNEIAKQVKDLKKDYKITRILSSLVDDTTQIGLNLLDIQILHLNEYYYLSIPPTVTLKNERILIHARKLGSEHIDTKKSCAEIITAFWQSKKSLVNILDLKKLKNKQDSIIESIHQAADSKDFHEVVHQAQIAEQLEVEKLEVLSRLRPVN